MPPETPGTTPAPTTRRALATARRRAARRKLMTIGSIAAVALVGGTGFAVYTTSGPATGTTTASHAADVEAQEAAIAESLSDAKAKSTISIANQVVAATSGKVDTSALETSVAALDDYESLDPDAVDDRVAHTASTAQTVQAAAAEVDKKVKAAAEKKAAEEKAAADAKAAAEAEAAAEAKAAAEAAAEAASLAEGNTVAGAQATAQRLASSDYGWGADQFSCLVSLWTKESGWNYQAYNANGGATGIPQALPGSKMASAGSDWATNASTQVAWGLDYIDRAYGSPCGAWSHSQAVNWY
ncbi:hypothetical protein [Frigoribacterium sp. Leaf172]|uniref:aggregation-promoting factor C-terminal-like domain-containing protein n=1 Tax=Frigoribacterium sp. Leaf172 TaxID=1736285 RepID=UPI0006FD1BC8|nr:hypothetical protein [Frigoribacterium sp. Leaf172]KQR65962.1 hypothetical protein ASF89_02005 [Frigoribacterium sp. Leaf172]